MLKRLCKFLKLQKDIVNLTIFHYKKTGKWINLRNPKTFGEKIQWLKIYDKNPLKTILSDKAAVREYVAEKGFSHILNEAYGVYGSPDDIDIDALPESFVLKANHGSGWNIICKDKSDFNWEEAKEKLRGWLNKKYANSRTLEWQYDGIKPAVLCEKYLDGENGNLVDYKFFCFNGEPIYVSVVRGRFVKIIEICIYDTNWVKQPFNTEMSKICEYEYEKPSKLDEMIEISRKLAQGFKFARIDFYFVDEKIIFGEITFTPRNGTFKFDPPEYDLILGEMLDLT